MRVDYGQRVRVGKRCDPLLASTKLSERRTDADTCLLIDETLSPADNVRIPYFTLNASLCSANSPFTYLTAETSE